MILPHSLQGANTLAYIAAEWWTNKEKKIYNIDSSKAREPSLKQGTNALAYFAAECWRDEEEKSCVTLTLISESTFFITRDQH